MNNISPYMNYNQDTQRELMKTNFNRRDSSEQRSDLIYKNFFNNNNYNNIQDERQRSYPYGFKRTPDKINLLKVNNVENYNYSAQKEEHPINKINRGYSLENIHNKYNRNSNNYKQSFKIVDYGYHTLAGTNQYYIPKTNQDSYLIKADKINSGEIEYTFGVFDGHGLQGHFVSQAIKQFLTNCSYFDFNTQPIFI